MFACDSDDRVSLRQRRSRTSQADFKIMPYGFIKCHTYSRQHALTSCKVFTNISGQEGSKVVIIVLHQYCAENCKHSRVNVFVSRWPSDTGTKSQANDCMIWLYLTNTTGPPFQVFKTDPMPSLFQTSNRSNAQAPKASKNRARFRLISSISIQSAGHALVASHDGTRWA